MVGSCKTCSKEFNYYPSNSAGKYCSRPCAYSNLKWREKQRQAKKGRVASKETRLKMSKAHKGKPHSKEWIANRTASFNKTIERRGRVTDEYTLLKASKAFKEWRKLVFMRDNYQCMACGDRQGGNLEADHIIPLRSLYEEAKIMDDFSAIYDIDNGRTLCTSCHKQTSTHGQRSFHQLEYRLIDAIRDLWKQSKNKTTLKQFYNQEMNGIIQNPKK